LELTPEEIRQIKIGGLHIAADQRFFLLFARRVRQLDHFHVDAVGLHLSHGQRVVGAKDAEAITVVRKRNIHFTSQSGTLLNCAVREICAFRSKFKVQRRETSPVTETLNLKL